MLEEVNAVEFPSTPTFDFTCRGNSGAQRVSLRNIIIVIIIMIIIKIISAEMQL